MPNIGYLPVRQPSIGLHHGSRARRGLLVAAISGSAALAVLVTPAQEAALAAQAAGPELTRLLRAMAGLKLIFAVAMVSATYWRLEMPAEAWRLASYSAAGAAVTAGPVLIWDMAHIRLGALLLHAGLLAGALLLWRDPAVGDRLGAIVARRRAVLRVGSGPL